MYKDTGKKIDKKDELSLISRIVDPQPQDAAEGFSPLWM